MASKNIKAKGSRNEVSHNDRSTGNDLQALGGEHMLCRLPVSLRFLGSVSLSGFGWPLDNSGSFCL